jgi:tricorn protease
MSSLIAISTVLISAPLYAVDTSDTRLIASPAITDGKIAFTYADDIWTANPDGTSCQRLTSHPGEERNPYFSPDGKTVAFTAAYDGNVDVFVVPTKGGEPRRLTWHPGDDIVRGFTPDGKVLFGSQRSAFSRRHFQFFTIGLTGGEARALPIPSGDKAAFSPDGKFLAYTPLQEAFQQWKDYRGGRASRIWILNLNDLAYTEIPKPPGGCNDTGPMWIGKTVYFLSDRDGEFNLYSYVPGEKSVDRLTRFDDFPVVSASAGAGVVVFEQAGWLHRFDPAARTSHRLKVGVVADLTEARPRYAIGSKFVRAVDISPTGKRIVIEDRGEIVTVPAKKGDPRNLTNTPGIHERSPVWSPDGKSIAYFSDASGEYALIVRPQDGQGQGRSYTIKGAGFYERPIWSPDSHKIAFKDNARALYWIDLASGAVERIGAEPIYTPFNGQSYVWSPDSKWLAYSLINTTSFQSVELFSLERHKSFQVTDGLAETSEPVFDSGGKYLYFLASTDAGPAKNWFDQSNGESRVSWSLYLLTLAKATPNPLLKESDEEAGETAKKADSPPTPDGKAADVKAADAKTSEAKAPVTAVPAPIVVDLDGIEGRILPLPVEPGNLANLSAGGDGQIYYLRRPAGLPALAPGGNAGASLKRFDLKTREEEALAEGIDGFKLSSDHKKLLYQVGEFSDGGLGAPPTSAALGVVDAGKFARGDGAVKLDAISVHVEPRTEWRQILREAWRINRDYFYAPNMHGTDWNAIWTKYEQFLPDLATRGDLNRVIRMMLSELAVGHSYLGGGERLYEPKTIPVGLLGADYDSADGRYRFKKIFGGAFWDPGVRAPLIAPGVDVKPGEFLLAVDGKDVKTDSEVYREFEGTVGRRIELKVGPRADGTGARTVTVEPIANEAGLRHRAWVEGNLRKVHERTGGKVAYVYVPDTANSGYASFRRYFFPQADKEAIIIDERYNGGGQVADYYIDLLRRPLVSYWATRYGAAIRTPSAAIMGPKVMIIDETAGSGGDLLPWMFRKFHLGKLIGKRTWGGLVGILGYPTLMDGGAVTAPNLAIFTKDGWIVENVGVAPDIEVEQDPALVAQGKDPQLDRAIETVLSELKTSPPPSVPARPPFPDRNQIKTRIGTLESVAGSSH